MKVRRYKVFTIEVTENGLLVEETYIRGRGQVPIPLKKWVFRNEYDMRDGLLAMISGLREDTVPIDIDPT